MKYRCSAALLLSALLPFAGHAEGPSADALAVIPLGEPETPVDQVLDERSVVVLEEIIVTARRRAESIDRIPVAVTAITETQLNRLAIWDTRDLEAAVPGFSVAELGFNRPVYSLRGIGFSDTSPTALSPVSIYLDEQLYPFDVMSTGANLDLERVEIIKGPQGVLYGRNTTGGAINYVARKPTPSFRTGSLVSYGSFQTLDAEGFVAGPIADNLRARFAIRSITSDQGWQESLTRPGDELGTLDKQSGRAILEWDVTEDLLMSVVLQGWRDESEPQAGQPIAIDPQNPTGGALFTDPAVLNHPTVSPRSSNNRVADWAPDYPWQLHNSFMTGSIKTQWTLSDQVDWVSHVGRYRFRSDDSAIPQSGLSLLNIESVIDTTMLATVAETRLLGTLDSDIAWQVGLHYADDTMDQNQLFLADNISALFPLPSSGAVPQEILALLAPGPIEPGKSLITDRLETDAHQKSDALALLASVDIPLTDTVNLDLGSRYTVENRDYRGCTHDSEQRSEGIGLATLASAVQVLRPLTNPGSPVATITPTGTACATLNPETNNAEEYQASLDDQTTSWRASLSWMARDELLLYVSHDRGFKSGNFPVLIASDAIQLRPVTKERLDTLEIGAKYAGGDLSAHLAAFYYDYRDKQLLSRTVDPVFGTLAKLENAPRSRLFGVEADTTWRPSRNWQFFASGAWLDSKVIEFVGINEDGVEQDFAGAEFNLAPSFSALASVDYARPITWHQGVVHAGVDYSYKSRTRTSLTAGPLFEHRPYRRLDASLGIALLAERWDVTLWGHNLLDALNTEGIYDPSDSVVRYTGMPRTLGIAVSYRYDP